MDKVLQLLGLVLPEIAHLPAIVAQFRSAFVKVGGDGADFDQIIADNRRDIDKLANPDGFRHAPAVPVARVTEGLYEIVMTGERPKKPQPSDLLYQFGEESRWFLREAGVGIEQPPPPWHAVE